MGGVIIVTGQTRGLGKAIVAALQERGDIVPSCRRYDMNVADGASIQRFADRIRRDYGRIDALVNNAAILGPVGDFQANPWASWEETIRVNLFGSAHVMQAMLPLMAEGGRIVNIAGGGAMGPLARRSAYATSKSALVRLTETIAQERPDLFVNAMLPGPLPTDMLQEIVDSGEGVPRPASDAIERAVALCLYLLSPESAPLTGRTISARYDPWPFDKAVLADICSTDAYTLRRVDEATRI